ncbi:MAG: TIGR04222 domain-containing membrane protein, partial [Verrucomicrobia bacterium]|nr:TIGR04222 domain-containing membrane protein [Verrucomicrobiota bacterium]
MPLNPFDLKGPEFLAFFACWAAVLVIGLVVLRRRGEAEEPSAEYLPQDPYEIAYLRGGKNHLLQTALVALVDRGLLEVKGLKLKTAEPGAVDRAQRLLDKAILTRFLWETEASALFKEESIVAQAEAIGEKLRGMRLLPDAGQKGARMMLFAGALALLWLVAGVKLYVALSRGRHNILFLIGLSIVFAIVFYKVANPFRTAAGQKVMKRIRERLGGLFARRGGVAASGATNEATLLAAAFGLSALPSVL